MSQKKEEEFLKKCIEFCKDDKRKIKNIYKLISIFIKFQNCIENILKSKLKKCMSVFMSLFCIFLILNICSYIFAGINIFNVKNYISKDNITTEFSRKGSDNSNDTEIVYKSFSDIKRDFKVTFSEPTYIPSNYTLEQISVNKNDANNKLQISAKYIKEQDVLIYNIFIFLTGNVKAKFTTEKTEDSEIIEVKDGIEYLYSSNYDWNTLKWVDANVAYILSNPESKEELYKIIENLKVEE